MANDERQRAAATPSSAEIETALARVLDSPAFANAVRQRDLLRHLVRHSLTGVVEHLKGYTIAVEVFGRNDDFDPMTNAQVRVEAARLRTRLREYYQGAGGGDVVIFDLPKGNYVMRFLRSADRPPVAASLVENTDSRIAVLPFLNLAPNGAGERFVDTVTDSVIFELSRLSGLTIAPRQASFATRGSSLQPNELAQKLRARHLLTGTVRQTAAGIGVVARLDDPHEGRMLWSERYDIEAGDQLSAQDVLARSIARAVRVQFIPSEAVRSGHEGTASLEAHDALLRGIAGYHRFSPRAIPDIRRRFEEAISFDPRYAAAHAWLARTVMHQWIVRWGDFSDALRDEALTHAQSAVDLDDRLSIAHTTLGWVHFWRRDKALALAHCRRGVALDPQSADALHYLSMVLSSAGEGEEALVFAERGRILGPMTPFSEFTHGQALFVLKDYEGARAAFERGCALSDSFMPNHGHLCITYAQLGMEEAMREKTSYFLATFGGDRTRFLALPWLDPQLSEHYESLLVKVGIR